jgi:hypothetical protein
MSKPVQMWRALDGKVFETRQKADAHDEAVTLLQEYKRIKPFEAENNNFYPLLTAILEHRTLTPRVYPLEQT